MRIVVLHAGGVGDLVLLESYLAALRERYPGARLELACRDDVAPVAALYARPPDAVHGFGFNPYRWALPDDDAALEVRTLLGRLKGDDVDVFVSAELRATWLSEALAAALAPRSATIADPHEASSGDLLILLGKLDLRRNAAVTRLAAVEDEHELDRYARLAGHGARRSPDLAPLAPNGTAAELVVFPFSATPANSWPLASMGAAAAEVAARRGAAVVLIGTHGDRPPLERAVALGWFGPNATVMTGAAADLPAVARRVAGALGYLGIDNGLVHLAAAYGVPGAAVFGGGTWPAYAPWAARSAGVVAPIPCFRCNWDCAFGRPFCTEAIDAENLVAAFEGVFDEAAPVIHARDAYTEREREILGAAAAVHRTAQADRAARLRAITRLRALIARYSRRMRSRSRKANAVLEMLAERTAHAARQLEAAAPTER
jgi:ADP-heptose:LPS heptosyltransferase